MTVTGLLLAANYILVATGFNLTFGIMKIVNFAHGVLYMLGAYTAFIAVMTLGLNYFLAVIAAIFFTWLLGWASERWLLRGEIRKDILAAIIVTLGLVNVFMASALLIFGERPKGFRSPFAGVAHVGNVVIPLEKLLPAAIALLLVVALHLFLKFTKTGQSLRAVSEDSEAAALMGIKVDRAYSMGFSLGAAMAGAAGALIAPIFVIEVGMGALPLWKTFVVVILGGMGSLSGCVLAGLLLGLIDSFVGTLVSPIMASILGFSAIILILMVRPQGFMGEKIEI